MSNKFTNNRIRGIASARKRVQRNTMHGQDFSKRMYNERFGCLLDVT